MARLTVYLPDELYHEARERLPDEVSWSSVLAEGLRARIDCAHDTVVCTTCRATVHTPVHTVEEDDRGGHAESDARPPEGPRPPDD